MLNLIYNKESYEKYEKTFFESMLEIANYSKDVILKIIENGEESTIYTRANYKPYYNYKSWPPDHKSNWIAKLYLENECYDYYMGSCNNDDFKNSSRYGETQIDSDIHFILDPNQKDNSSLFFAEDDVDNSINLLLKIDLSTLSEIELFTADDKNSILAISNEETNNEHYYLNLGNILTNSPSYNLRNIVSNSTLSLTENNYVKFESININDISKVKYEKKKEDETIGGDGLQLGDFMKGYRFKLIPEETVFDPSLSIEEMKENEDETINVEPVEAEEIQEIENNESTPQQKLEDIDTFNREKEENEFIELEENEVIKNINQEDVILKTESKIKSINAAKSTQYLIHHVINLMKSGKPLETILKTLEIPQEILNLWHEQGKAGNKDFIEFYNIYELFKNKAPHEIREEEKLRSHLNLKVKSQLKYILEENNIDCKNNIESEMINRIIHDISIDNIYASLEKLEQMEEKEKEIRTLLKKLNNKQLINLLSKNDLSEYGNRTKNEKIEKIMSDTQITNYEKFLENIQTMIEIKGNDESFESTMKINIYNSSNIIKLKEVQNILKDLLNYYNPSECFTKDDLYELGFSRFDVNHSLWVLKDYNLINFVTKEKFFLKENAIDFADKDFDALKIRDYSNLQILSSESENNKSDIIIKGLIDEGDLFDLFKKLEEYENDIVKVISDSRQNGKINILIEMDADYEKLEDIKKLLN